MRLLISVLRDKRGGSALEFALVAVPFILVVLGTIEFARLTFYQASLSNGATAAARLLLINPVSTPAMLKQDVALGRSTLIRSG